MLNDSFYEDDDYYWDCKPNNKKLTGPSTSTNSLNWSCSLSSSLQPDTSTSTFLSLPLKPVQSSSPNSKTQASSTALPHILSESFNSSFSSSSVSPPNSSISSSANRLSTSFSLSTVVSSQSSSLSPGHQKHRQNIILPVSRRIMTVAPGRSHETKNNDSSFMCQNHKSNFPPCHKRNNNWLLPPLDPSSAVSREKILQLIERTKQRRERLKEISETDLTARKRRPLTEDNSVNIKAPLEDDSPKRQCLREEEQAIKPDTPAIRSVRSRQTDLTSSKSFNSEDEYIPVPVPRKSLSQEENRNPNSENKRPESVSKFAMLAQKINSWDDDYSYHTIKQNEIASAPKPTIIKDATSLRLKSPAPIAPQTKSPAPIAPGSASHFKSPAPIAPQPKSLASPQICNVNEIDDLEAIVDRLAQQTNTVSPKRNFKFTPSCDPIQGISSHIPINSKGLNESLSNGEVTDDEPTNKSVSERLAKWNKKVSETDVASDSGPSSPVKSSSGSPSKSGINQNFSSRLALLEKNLATSPVKSNKSAMPISTATPSPLKKDISSVQFTPEPPVQCAAVTRVKENKNRRESFEPTRESVSKRMADWQKKVAAVDNTKEKEPTAYPVNARMSAWEKVTCSGNTPVNKMIKPQGNVLPTAGRPQTNICTIPSKPFVPKSPVAARKIEVSPVKSDPSVSAKALSPAKASCAMKAIHQRLFESQNQNTTHSLAEKIRQERMAELKVIENRWQNGLLKEHYVTNSDVESVSNEGPTETCSPSQGSAISRPSPRSDSVIPPPPPLPPISTDSATIPPLTSTTVSISAPTASPSTMMTTAGPTSIFKLIASSQASPAIKKTSVLNTGNTTVAKTVIKQVRFEDSFESSDDCTDSVDNGLNTSPADDLSSDNEAEKTLESRRDLLSPEEEDDADYTYSSSEENEALASQAATNARSYIDSESDDVSISAFVPEAVRQQCKLSLQTESCSNILALARKQQQQQLLDTNNCSFDSMEDQHIQQDTFDDSDISAEGTSVDDALDEALDMDTDDRVMEKTPINYSANKRGSHSLATCTDSCFDDESTTDDDVVMRDRSPLVYSISMYRSKRFSNNVNVTPVQKIIRNSKPVSTEEEMDSESSEDPPVDNRKAILERIKEFNNQIALEQTVILQTSNALNQCCTEGSSFNGSTQQVECHKLLLIACQKRRAYLAEIQRLKETNCLDHLGHGTRGTLTVSDIRLPLKKDFVSKMTTVHDMNVFYYVILIRNGPQVYATQLMSTHDPMVRGSLDFPNMIKLNNITSKFEVSLELYEMKICKEKSKDKKKKQKKCKGMPSTPVSIYPTGLSDIHTSSFSLTWSVVLTMKSIDKTSFTMERVPYESPLIGSIYLRMKCMMETNISERGFLTMFEDVSGLGAWHRRWCVLSGNKLKYWKYPDDENRKDPIGYIDLKRCITEKVGLISGDVCARPNTFEMCTVRPLRPGEEDTLTTRKHTTMATVRHMMSADTKEERILWCNKVNQALDNIRSWQPDALRPVKMTIQAM